VGINLEGTWWFRHDLLQAAIVFVAEVDFHTLHGSRRYYQKVSCLSIRIGFASFGEKKSYSL
jgi:hypothetical protein